VNVADPLMSVRATNRVWSNANDGSLAEADLVHGREVTYTRGERA
jgi:hypothetical protein